MRLERIVSLFARCFEYSDRVGATPLLREVVQPLDKADDLMLFYCALCSAKSRNGEHVNRGISTRFDAIGVERRRLRSHHRSQQRERPSHPPPPPSTLQRGVEVFANLQVFPLFTLPRVHRYRFDVRRRTLLFFLPVSYICRFDLGFPSLCR